MYISKSQQALVKLALKQCCFNEPERVALLAKLNHKPLPHIDFTIRNSEFYMYGSSGEMTIRSADILVTKALAQELSERLKKYIDASFLDIGMEHLDSPYIISSGRNFSFTKNKVTLSPLEVIGLFKKMECLK